MHSLASHPLANESRAVKELDALVFTDVEEPDDVHIHEGEFVQIQDEARLLLLSSELVEML